MNLHIGDIFQVRKRYDNGGYPFIRLTRVHGLAVFVRDLDAEKRPMSGGRERPFHSPTRPAREVLRKYWKRTQVGKS